MDDGQLWVDVLVSHILSETNENWLIIRENMEGQKQAWQIDYF